MRKTISVLINNLDTAYQRDIWEGIEEAAVALDVNVVVVQCGILDSMRDFDAFRDRFYRYITPENIDGLILVFSTLVGQLGVSSLFDRFMPLLDRIPSINIGPPREGFPSVSVDNRSGLEALVDHLVVDHGRRHFVFVGGPIHNPDSDEREQAFLRALARHGLDPAPDGVMECQFRRDVTAEKLGAWLDLGHQLDAIVAANDVMADTCCAVLSARGVVVPHEVSVTGFDDAPSARFFPVPLTTVFQPVREVGKIALETLVRAIDEDVPGESLVLPTRPVIRQSCGCFSAEVMAAGHESVRSDPIPGEESLVAAFGKIGDDPSRADDFLRIFQAMLRDREHDNLSAGDWENCVSRLRRSFVGVEDGHRPADTALHQCRIMVREHVESRQSAFRLAEYNRNRSVQYAIAYLIGSFSLRNLVSRLAENLDILGIRNCYMSLSVPEADKPRSRLILAYSEGQRIDLPPDGVEFDSVGLFPVPFVPSDRRFSFIVDLLFHENSQIGLFAFTPKSGEIDVSNALISQIRSSLRASLLVDELVEKDARLNAAFDQLRQRADELEAANVLIRQNQERLISSEKMASLGRLTAGIAHEMNTPLAAVRASLAELSNLAGEYSASIGDPDVSAKDHREIAGEMAKSLVIASRAAERASAFIRGIKNQTRDDPSDDSGVPFDVGTVIQDTVVLLAHALRQGNCTAEFDHPLVPVILFGKPGKLSQILTNLVINSIDSMAPSGGIVRIDLSTRADTVVVSVRDTGCGIAPENRQRIFDPLFTTKSFGVGTGLGLTIVHNIVVGDFCGDIKVESVPGKGTCFTVILPAKKAG